MSHKVRVSALAGQSQKASLGPAGISPTLFASDVPPEQFVEMRVLSPRELLASTGGPGWSLRMDFRRSWTRRPRKSSIRGPLGTANAPACAVRAAVRFLRGRSDDDDGFGLPALQRRVVRRGRRGFSGGGAW